MCSDLVGRLLLVVELPMAYLLHLLGGAEVNGPETPSAWTLIETQMQMAGMPRKGSNRGLEFELWPRHD